jgi:hypothetical protein
MIDRQNEEEMQSLHGKIKALRSVSLETGDWRLETGYLLCTWAGDVRKADMTCR